jgi:two-component system, LytTR family, sensor kinase
MYNNYFFLKYKVHHVVFWGAIFFIWYYLRADDYANAATAVKVTLIKVADLALLIYITNYLLLPFLLYRKKYFSFALAFITLIFFGSILKMNILGRMLNNPALYNWSNDWKGRVYDNILPHFFLVTAGVAVKLVIDYVRLQRRMAEIAKEKAEAELNFLKSQINPHFIFNSLNAVHFLIKKDNPEARTALQQFSDMLRYQLYEMDGQKIPLEKEISFLKDYVNMQQLRMDENYDVQLKLDLSLKGLTIEPLLLIPLVENAFKHVSHHAAKKNFVHIGMGHENDSFCFKVENSKEDQLAMNNGNGGIGLQNVKRRLELLYPGKHELKLRETPDNFSVILKIKLT